MATSETTLSKRLDDGSWWFHLRALDGAGSWSGASHLGPFWIDTTAPETTIDAAPPAETSERSAAFAFSSEAATSFSCSLDSAASDDCVSPFSYPALPLGGHVFTVTARDRAGNVDQTPAEHRWTIVSAPAPSPPPPPPPPVEPPRRRTRPHRRRQSRHPLLRPPPRHLRLLRRPRRLRRSRDRSRRRRR